MSRKVTRTYGSISREPRLPCPSSPPSELSSSPIPERRKRPLIEQPSFTNLSQPPAKRLKLKSTHTTVKPRKSSRSKAPVGQKTLTQLHFSIDTSVLRTCPICDLSYTKGAPDDEALHRAHCSRVQKGLEWGREEEREAEKAGVKVVEEGIRLKGGKRGRIICVKADVGGKIGSKLNTLFETINLTLSSPPMTTEALHASKAYLFLTPSVARSTREKIVGCVIAQRIQTAMAIATLTEVTSESSSNNLVVVDSSTSLFCNPTRLPTPLGIPRLFVPSTHRRQGIASKLLSVAASSFIHGCPLDPRKGDVAFTQPTGDGSAVMRAWGGGGVRIYEE
ncbi:hypothetical protein ONZ45_g5481 [Pleurotus djamor]|nr:hypothetical protein ONZ45_g5481 [Pleurotus djamor]